MEEMEIGQYLYMDYNAYKQMIKNQRNVIGITILPYDKYKNQTAEEIAKDLKQMEEEMNQNERQEEHMRQAQLGWNEIQVKSINEHINLHVEYLKEEMEKENGNS